MHRQQDKSRVLTSRLLFKLESVAKVPPSSHSSHSLICPKKEIHERGGGKEGKEEEENSDDHTYSEAVYHRQVPPGHALPCTPR